MKTTNTDDQLGYPDRFDNSTQTLAVSNQCFAAGKKLVSAKTDQRVLTEGAK